MVAINSRKQKFAVMHGSFAADGVRDFLYDLSQGRGSVSLSSMTGLPEIKSSTPWDGKDAPVRYYLLFILIFLSPRFPHAYNCKHLTFVNVVQSVWC